MSSLRRLMFCGFCFLSFFSASAMSPAPIDHDRQVETLLAQYPQVFDGIKTVATLKERFAQLRAGYRGECGERLFTKDSSYKDEEEEDEAVMLYEPVKPDKFLLSQVGMDFQGTPGRSEYQALTLNVLVEMSASAETYIHQTKAREPEAVLKRARGAAGSLAMLLFFLNPDALFNGVPSYGVYLLLPHLDFLAGNVDQGSRGVAYDRLRDLALAEHLSDDERLTHLSAAVLIERLAQEALNKFSPELSWQDWVRMLALSVRRAISTTVSGWPQHQDVVLELLPLRAM